MTPIEHQLWHPVADPLAVTDQPLAVQLMGWPLVLWRNSEGQVQGLHDQCPHRGAKLSMGRVCEGQLQCPYHGWRFNGQGQCTRVPAMPDFQPGPAQQARSVMVREAYGLLWVCLTDTDHGLPVFLAETQTGLRKLNAGPYEVATSAPRIVENFLDMAHFSFVHEGWLGDAAHAQIPDYQVHTTAQGFKLINAQAWQPQSSALASQGAMVAYTYEVVHPYSAVLTKVPSADSGVKPGYEESIALFIQPLEATRSRVWFRMAIADFEVPSSKVLDFQNTIFLQDQPVLESQRPQLLPLKAGAESFVAVDKGSAAYRRLLQQLGITYGVC
jgi:phenylpropionate dioxygenase-like ring-hydroxylating dioxygenase large terminal subunit